MWCSVRLPDGRHKLSVISFIFWGKIPKTERRCKNTIGNLFCVFYPQNLNELTGCVALIEGCIKLVYRYVCVRWFK